jgi:hypothetical protein
MFTTRTSKVSVVLLVFAAILVTASFVTRSAAVSANRAYDGIEEVHVSRVFAHASELSSYDPIENLRAHRALSAADYGYNLVEQIRMGRTVNASADRSYDTIENLRGAVNTSLVFAYDQIEVLRMGRGVSPVAAASAYDLIEQLRLGRTSLGDQSYDSIEAVRLHR